MNKIIPFNKDITFNDNIGEIVSIALDDTLKFDTLYNIKGELIVRGCNKVNEMEEEFSYSLPVEIAVDDKYDTSKASIGVDDFYYEIINDNILRVKIDLILDDLYYKEQEVTKEERKIDFDLSLSKNNDDLSGNLDILKDEKEKLNVDFNKSDDNLNASLDISKDAIKEDKKITDLFKKMSNDEDNNEKKEYSIYRVYVLRDDDTIDSILNKYKITKEELEDYNDLLNIKPGDKLIIPSSDE